LTQIFLTRLGGPFFSQFCDVAKPAINHKRI
jgi:hypothetical protein